MVQIACATENLSTSFLAIMPLTLFVYISWITNIYAYKEFVLPQPQHDHNGNPTSTMFSVTFLQEEREAFKDVIESMESGHI